MNWDATQLPLRDGVVDVIISDLPFGHRCGNKKSNQRMYPAFLKECHRVLSKDGGRAILLTLERGLMKSVLNNLCYPPSSSSNSNDGESGGEQKEEKNKEGTTAVLEGKRIAPIKVKETILKREAEGAFGGGADVSNKKPLFILRRPEFCIDMGGLYPYCFELIKN